MNAIIEFCVWLFAAYLLIYALRRIIFGDNAPRSPFIESLANLLLIAFIANLFSRRD